MSRIARRFTDSEGPKVQARHLIDRIDPSRASTQAARARRQARAELRRRAADNLHGVPAAARKVLASTNAPLHRVATAPSSGAS